MRGKPTAEDVAISSWTIIDHALRCIFSVEGGDPWEMGCVSVVTYRKLIDVSGADKASS
jgi:hypothetical protein